MAFARFSGAVAFNFSTNAYFSGSSAPSTFVQAAQLTIASTFSRFTISRIASRLVISRYSVFVFISSPAIFFNIAMDSSEASTTSVKTYLSALSLARIRISFPNWPLAPVTSIFIINTSLR